MKSTEEFLKSIENSVTSYIQAIETRPVKRLLKTQIRPNPYWKHNHKIADHMEDATNAYSKILSKNIRK